jgi:malate permease and related proteins
MSNILLLIVCLFLGILLRGVKLLPQNAPQTLNTLIVNVFVPAVALRHGVDLEFSSAFFLPILATWIVFGMAFLLFNISKKWSGFDRQTIGALCVVGGISSISFVGFPIFEMLYGAEGLRAGIVMSQAGTFLICSTAGIIVCSVYAERAENVNWWKIGRDIVAFPPFLAFVIAILLTIMDYQHPPLIANFLEKLGSPMSIIALLSIGLQMDFSTDATVRKSLMWGLVYKLLIAPALIYLIFIVFMKENSVTAKVSVVGSALGSMNTIGIVAIKKGLNPALVTKLLAISIPLSLLIVPLVYWILENFSF